MANRSKFTADRRQRILEILAAGGSRRTAAALAQVDHQTLARWLKRGQEASEGSRWRQFYDDVQQAEAHPRIRALQVINREMPDNPRLAMWFLERREPGFAPRPHVEEPVGPVVIQLSLDKPEPGR